MGELITRELILARMLSRVERVTESGCWIWTGSVGGHGYGTLYYERRNRNVHKLMYELTKEVVPKGLWLCHRCNIRLCINPDHLYVGTPKDNGADAAAVDAYPQRKLTPEQVIEIKSMKGKISAYALAPKYKINRRTISHIWAGDNWNYLERTK